ncbi:MAG: lipocalin family protein, partial [Actinomycetia bacterium]|nr:lipocalin family protein [Actinomycetes bacterium]MCH9760891.1 lipocalin family protein [Actinomycetes bacterium]
MTERGLWLGAGVVFAGLGAAVFTGAGVAAADSDASDGGSSSSTGVSTDSNSSRSTDAQGDDTSTDPGDTTSFSDRSDAEPPDVDADSPSSEATDNPAVTLHRQDDEDGDAAAAADSALADEALLDGVSGDEVAAFDGDVDADAIESTESETVAGDEPAVSSASSTAVSSATSTAEASRTTSNTADGEATAVVATSQEADTSTAAVEPVTRARQTSEAQSSALASADTVTGVKTGHAKLTIPLNHGYTTAADWYFPTQADGSVSASGVIWLQHGFLNRKSFVSALATTLSQDTNSIVVAPNVASFPWRCASCWLNGVELQQAVATMFVGDRAALNSSAMAAGLMDALPEDFVLSGQSAGGGFATAVGGYYASDPVNDGSLRGVVMFDGFAFGGVVSNALQSLDDPYIPVYQVAAPPQLWNLFGATTTELVDARPGQFVGATLARGSHADALLGGNPLIDFLAQLVTKFSPPGNTAATHTLSTGWINDMYQGLGPVDGNGIYGAPDQYIVMGDTAAVVLAPPPVVDLNDYLGTWYEVGSVKQFFSIGLVNTKAVYSLNPDDSI